MGNPAPFCMQKAALTPSLLPASSWQLQLWHSFSNPKCSQFSPRTSNDVQCGVPLPVSFSKSNVCVCVRAHVFMQAHLHVCCRESRADAYRFDGISCKCNCSSVTSQIITSYACFFTLECLFCNQDIQVSASFWRIWSLSEITVQIKAFYSY